ncbi:MAG: beta-Ala-His dipeptidase [Planctomycetes bacterium]|nr:beta-Ala-His dipeptidase [Planctomycetota bacterium]
MSNETNLTAVKDLEPQSVWRLFAGIAAVPRCSKHEENIRKHMRAVAEGLGFRVREDAPGNMVIEIPATPGHEKAPITVLQGHVDMVCEKNSGTAHDFAKDQIKLIVGQDANGAAIVHADQTTLGADNGIGLAMALAAASAPDVVHGPLELLCTVDEEAGMTGAKALQPGFFKGKRLLNLDSEEDNVIYIGCAGGCDVSLSWKFQTSAPPAGAEACRVTVAGLRGGHSGGDIHLNRANANRLLVQTLRAAGSTPVQLVSVKGGTLRNALPREATALVVGPQGVTAALQRTAEFARSEAIREAGEDGCTITVAPASADGETVLSTEDTHRLLTALTALPHGVLAIVPEIRGLVQTSNNVATVVSAPVGDSLKVDVGCLTRSSVGSDLYAAVRQIKAVGRLAGAEVASGNEYPGWKPNVDSPLLATCRRIYEEAFDESPNVTAIHAGLECGIIGERMGGGIDMVSFGPKLTGPHSPDECVYIDSVQKSWKYLTAVLAELAKG